MLQEVNEGFGECSYASRTALKMPEKVVITAQEGGRRISLPTIRPAYASTERGSASGGRTVSGGSSRDMDGRVGKSRR